MKYKIKIIKEEERENNKFERYIDESNDRVIFQANISPDLTIELLQHLNDYKERDKQI